MKVEIGCRELGRDCDFMAYGESKQEILYRIMRHVQEEHTDDWFDVEEIYAAAIALIQQRAV
jgi:predicted small metal-binding protein